MRLDRSAPRPTRELADDFEVVVGFLGLFDPQFFFIHTSSVTFPLVWRRPSTFSRAAIHLRLRAAANLATRVVFSNSAMAPRTWRTMTAVGESINPRERHDFVALDDPADKVRIKRGDPLGIVQVEQIDPFEPQGL